MKTDSHYHIFVTRRKLLDKNHTTGFKKSKFYSAVGQWKTFATQKDEETGYRPNYEAHSESLEDLAAILVNDHAEHIRKTLGEKKYCELTFSFTPPYGGRIFCSQGPASKTGKPKWIESVIEETDALFYSNKKIDFLKAIAKEQVKIVEEN